jgi:prephenate dehydrogenase
MTALPRSVGLLGYGRFGRAFAELLLDAGVSVAAYDPHEAVPKAIAADCPGTLAERSEAVLLCVPVDGIEAALADLGPHLTPKHLVLDVASVKHGPVLAFEKLLGARVPWAATHPLFGPTSIARDERPLRAVVCPNPAHPDAAARARALYEAAGCEVIEEDADAHDRVMAKTHALAFYIAKGMLEVAGGDAIPFAPPSFKAMEQTIDAVRSDAGHLFYPIAHGNPHAARARAELLEALKRIHDSLEGEGARRAETADAPAQDRHAIPEPAGKALPLGETRELIDELDAEIVALLARRERLAERAARLKESEGLPVRDAEREKSLLEDRRGKAETAGLSPDDVAAVFDAIMRLSRNAQDRYLKSRGGPATP